MRSLRPRYDEALASRTHRFVLAPLQRFFRLEAAGGIMLAAATIAALSCANSSAGAAYRSLVAPIHALVNDGLMTLFFLVAGMEIKRELVRGELRTWRRAALPLVAAAGGMLAPALVYLALSDAPRGWAIPTATDIAFALGALSLVKSRVPRSLFVFLTALAIFDDLGAILVIALAYGGRTNLAWIGAAAALVALLVLLIRRGVRSLGIFTLVGAALWLTLDHAGLHPTLAGVIVGLAIPAHDDRVLVLRRPIEFGVVPLFAFVNAGVPLAGSSAGGIAFAVAAALVAGKALGVFGSVALAVKLRLAPMPTGSRWPQILGVALLAGVGFTMSLFVTELAFADRDDLAVAAKLGILGGSLVSATLGLILLRALTFPLDREPAP